MKILVTGFAPFDGESINPAWQAVQALPEEIGGAQVLKRELPTSFAGGPAELRRQVLLCRPDLVLCVGQAGGADAVRVERVAIDLADARIPDNDGAQPVDEPLEPGGPPACFATLPVKAMVRAVQAAGFPCRLSYTAGTYVCNAVMYAALRLAAQNPPLRAGFVHVPYCTAQLPGKPAGTPALPLADLTAALQAAVLAAVQEKQDLGEQMGALD